jgi:hypothetical protein
VLEGFNDIGFSSLPNTSGFAPTTDVSAAEIIGGYKQIIERAHEAGLRVIGGTILPDKGSFYYSDAGEAKRQAVNDWIRHQSTFDGVVDFDAVVRDPAPARPGVGAVGSPVARGISALRMARPVGV